MEKIRVTRRFTFDMAHALYGHDGPCRNIHGHTYHLEVTILGSPLKQQGQPRDGMVMDFSDLKTIVNREIIEQFDHALVLNEDSPHKKLSGLKDEFDKIVFLPVQPTCENLLIVFKNKLQHFFDSHHQLVSVKLRETPKASAEWHKEDN